MASPERRRPGGCPGGVSPPRRPGGTPARQLARRRRSRDPGHAWARRTAVESPAHNSFELQGAYRGTPLFCWARSATMLALAACSKRAGPMSRGVVSGGGGDFGSWCGGRATAARVDRAAVPSPHTGRPSVCPDRLLREFSLPADRRHSENCSIIRMSNPAQSQSSVWGGPFPAAPFQNEVNKCSLRVVGRSPPFSFLFSLS